MRRLLLLVMFLVGLLGGGLAQAGVVPIQGKQHTVVAGKIRAFHFVLRGVSLKAAQRMIDVAHDAGFNSVQVSITDGVRLEHSPWNPRSDAWSKTDFKTWVVYTRSKGIEIIPEFKLLTHQELFFQGRFPDLMFNSNTYDPRKEETYRQVFSLLNEVIELTGPRAIHIGHDELAGRLLPENSSGLKAGEVMLPAELFLHDVLRLHAYLKARDIETWMWGDMLISPEEFPEMLDRDLHGSVVGYGKPLRAKLPKDIVICDWHYDDDQLSFTSLGGLQREGFRVIGSTWRKVQTTRNFSRYSADHDAYGMMATTWFHVQRKEWDVVERIIRESGAIYLRDFPDVQ